MVAAAHRLRRAAVALALALGGAALVAMACGTGDISDLTAGHDAAIATADAEASAPDAAVCIHASPPERPTTADLADVAPIVFAFTDLRFSAVEQDGGGPPRPKGLDLDQTCTCPEPESCKPPDSGTPRPCDGDAGEDNAAGELLTLASSGASGFKLDVVRSQIRAGLFSMLVTMQGWNGQPDDPAVLVGVGLSGGTEGIQSDAGRPEPKFDGKDVWTVTPSSVLGGGDRIGTDCRSLLCSPANADARAYVRGGVIVAHLDISLPIETSAGTLTMDFLDATITGKLSMDNGVPHLVGEISGRWPVDRLLAAFARVRNPQTDIALCASDAGLAIYQILKGGVCEAADLAAMRAFDLTAAKCEALSDAVSFTAVKAILGTVYKSDRQEPNDCPDFTDRCPD